MNKIKFVKMHGAGNDFVMIDDRDGTFPCENSAYLEKIGTRGTGIGCEGIILVQKSETAEFKMRFFNPDGSEADLCGNGARCVAVFAREIGAAKADRMVFETRAGRVDAAIIGPGLVRVLMPDPHGLRDDFVIAGVPHRIVPVDDLERVDVNGRGSEIRYSAEFAPEGTNVDFVTYSGKHDVEIRTYERGVEAESGACGTGSVASAVVGVAQHGLEFPVHVRTWGGYDLLIHGEYVDGSFRNITLTGPVERVFDGSVSLETDVTLC